VVNNTDNSETGLGCLTKNLEAKIVSTFTSRIMCHLVSPNVGFAHLTTKTCSMHGLFRWSVRSFWSLSVHKIPLITCKIVSGPGTKCSISVIQIFRSLASCRLRMQQYKNEEDELECRHRVIGNVTRLHITRLKLFVGTQDALYKVALHPKGF